MRIRPATLSALWAAVSVPPGGTRTLTQILTVEGGLACRFTNRGWDDPALTALAPRLAEEIGYKTVEHAADHQVVIRCTSDGCRIDLGDGFEELAIREADDA